MLTTVAIVLTVYGIETIALFNPSRASLAVAIVLTVYGIETCPEIST